MGYCVQYYKRAFQEGKILTASKNGTLISFPNQGSDRYGCITLLE